MPKKMKQLYREGHAERGANKIMTMKIGDNFISC